MKSINKNQTVSLNFSGKELLFVLLLSLMTIISRKNYKGRLLKSNTSEKLLQAMVKISLRKESALKRGLN